MLNDKMIDVMCEVGQELAERGDLIEKMAIALLTGKNLFILGDTGQAKSQAINLFRKRITGAKQFERLLSKQTDEEQLFGRLDLGSLIPGNVAKADFETDSDEQDKWRLLDESTQRLEAYRKTLAALHGGDPRVITTGKIPESHICFIDEVFKANDGILNALLTALNERRYTNEGYTVDIPVISFFAASNEIPNFSDPAESILRPLYDRFELKVVTRYVEDKQARLDMLSKIQRRSSAPGTGAVITLDELYAMQAEVRAVIVPDSINELMDDILCRHTQYSFFSDATVIQCETEMRCFYGGDSDETLRSVRKNPAWQGRRRSSTVRSCRWFRSDQIHCLGRNCLFSA